MATPHNAANVGDFAETVLMPGDPLRVKFIAENFLENVKTVNTVRNCLGYTGNYKGSPVSVMASGMGMPSIGIYSYELFKFYNVSNIIRVGSAGSYTKDLNVLDVCLAESAYTDSTYALMQNGYQSKINHPDSMLNTVILKKAKDLEIPIKMAKVHSTDVFYREESMGDYIALKNRINCDCVEMESFALFHNANILGKRAACILTISDSFVTKIETSSKERESSFTDMMKIALETAISV